MPVDAFVVSRLGRSRHACTHTHTHTLTHTTTDQYVLVIVVCRCRSSEFIFSAVYVLLATRRAACRGAPPRRPALSRLLPLRETLCAGRRAGRRARGPAAPTLNSEKLSRSRSLTCSLLFSRSALATLTGVSRASRPSAEFWVWDVGPRRPRSARDGARRPLRAAPCSCVCWVLECEISQQIKHVASSVACFTAYKVRF